MRTSTVAKLTRQAVIANGEKSTKAMALHRKDVPQMALTSSKRPRSQPVGGLIFVKMLPNTHCKVISTTRQLPTRKA